MVKILLKMQHAAQTATIQCSVTSNDIDSCVFVSRGYQQQDAHEFMRYLLDHLHRELQYSRNGAAHPVSPQDGVRLSTAEGKCCM